MRTAKRLFGVRSDNYEVAPEMAALLLGRDVRANDNLDDETAALAACDVFPDASYEKVVKLLNGTTPVAGVVDGAPIVALAERIDEMEESTTITVGRHPAGNEISVSRRADGWLIRGTLGEDDAPGEFLEDALEAAQEVLDAEEADGA